MMLICIVLPYGKSMSVLGGGGGFAYTRSTGGDRVLYM